VGWFQSGEVEDRWVKRPVLEWLRETAEDVDAYALFPFYV
jgi:hypothetical protein